MTNYTQEQLSEMSDFEVNKAVAEKLGEFIEPPYRACTEVVGDKLAYYDDMRNITMCHEDYCNSWADAGPIAEKYGISVITGLGIWIAFFWDDNDMESSCKSPTRAICECFLMMENTE